MKKNKNVKLLNSGEIEYLENGNISIISFEGDKSQKLIEHLANEVNGFKLKSDYANEIYLLYYLKKCEWACQLDSLADANISIAATGSQGVLWRSMLKGKFKLSLIFRVRDYARSLFLTLLSFILMLSSCLFTPLFLLWRVITTNNIKNIDGNLCVVRSPATFSKMSMIDKKLNLILLSEDIVYKNSSLISLFSLISVKEVFYRLFLIPFIIMRDCILVIKESKLLLGRECVGDTLWYFSKRIVIKAIYEVAFQLVCSKQGVKKLYTGNKEDRYAMLESRITLIENKPLICIPHGLEYAIKFPTNVAGNIFYTTSVEASEYLNCLYSSKKFIYDKCLMSTVFTRNDESFNTYVTSRKIVFFSESRDIHVNISIVKALHNSGHHFSIKLHPKDSKSNYEGIGFDVKFINDYNDAISNNICIARKSTVLLEALFNNSFAIAYLENSKDKYYVTHVFPSLGMKGINHVFCKSELMEKLKLFLKVK